MTQVIILGKKVCRSKKVNIELSGPHEYVWSKINTAHLLHHSSPSPVKHGDGIIMLWESISSKGTGKLVQGETKTVQ